MHELAIATLLMLVSLVVALWYVVWKYGCQLTPILLFFAFSVLFGWFGHLALAWEGERSGLFLMFLSVFSTFVSLAGIEMYDLVSSGSVSKSIKRFQKASLSETGSANAVSIALVVVGVGVGCVQYRGLPPVTVSMLAVAGGGKDVATVRVENSHQRYQATKSQHFDEGHAGSGVLRSLIFALWSYASVVSLCRLLVSRSFFQYAMCVAIIAGMVLFVGGDGTRESLMSAILILLLGFNLVRSLSLRYLAFFSLAAVLAFALMTFFSAKHRSDVGVLAQLGERFSQNASNDAILVNLVDNGDFPVRYGGLHLQEIVNAIPGRGGSISSVYSQILALDINVAVTGRSDSSTFWTPTYLGRMYVEGRVWSVFVFSLLLGWVVALTVYWVFSREKTPSNVAFAAIATFFVAKMVMGGPVSLFANLFTLLLVHFGFVFTVRSIMTRKWTG